MTANKSQKNKSDIVWWLIIIGLPIAGIAAVNLPPTLRLISDKLANQSPKNLDANYRYQFSETLRNRSEERRVGKEC